MRNYKNSDYAVNKCSKNIIYLFADGTQEITLEDYLKSYPDKTKQDFAELKALSDEIYYAQDRDDTRYGKRKRCIEGYEETEQFATPSLEAEVFQKNDEEQALTAAKRLLDSGELTDIQHRRFVLHYFKGLSTRQIAALEGVNQSSVVRALGYAQVKLQKVFDKM